MNEPAYVFYRVYYRSCADPKISTADFDTLGNARKYVKVLQRYPSVFTYGGTSMGKAFIEPGNGRIHCVFEVIE